MPMYDEICGPTKHIFIHSTMKIEKDVQDVEYSKLTGAIVKTVRFFAKNF
jgi:hypothetical protein